MYVVISSKKCFTTEQWQNTFYMFYNIIFTVHSLQKATEEAKGFEFSNSSKYIILYYFFNKQYNNISFY